MSEVETALGLGWAWTAVLLAVVVRRHRTLQRQSDEMLRMVNDRFAQLAAPSGPSTAPSADPADLRNVMSLADYRFDPSRQRTAAERSSLDRWSREW